MTPLLPSYLITMFKIDVKNKSKHCLELKITYNKFIILHTELYNTYNFNSILFKNDVLYILLFIEIFLLLLLFLSFFVNNNEYWNKKTIEKGQSRRPIVCET